jgi:hypothetical protein
LTKSRFAFGAYFRGEPVVTSLLPDLHSLDHDHMVLDRGSHGGRVRDGFKDMGPPSIASPKITQEILPRTFI